MAERVPASLLAALADVMNWLDAAHIPSMVIGGVASSMLGRARLTQDVDALVSEAGGLYDRIMARDPADRSCRYLFDR